MPELFKANPARVQAFSVEACGVYLDYSKHRIDAEIHKHLIDLAQASGLDAWRLKMACGEQINHTEERAVAHMALRAFKRPSYSVQGKDVMVGVRKQLNRMRVFVNAVRSQSWRGYTGKPIKRVVNIGIGGSELGPKMVVEALTPYAHPDIQMHYVSNVDSSAMHRVLSSSDAQDTLFIICSKSFKTQETKSNADIARHWFLEQGGSEQTLQKHFVAVTTNNAEASHFGIHPDQQFDMWDWVGGRFSLWSTIGLSIAITIGMPTFIDLLSGAQAMDEHFLSAPLEKNIPVLMALLGVWYSSFMGAQTHAIIPYDEYLHLLPDYMQQLDMESNGKCIDREGKTVNYATAPVVWGSSGTNGQHAYFQLLHQGGRLIPADFILVKNSHNPLGNNHQQLLANGIAQMEALMVGKTEAQARKELALGNYTPEQINRLAPYQVFAGSQPCSALVLDKVTPQSLGALIAAYEHKIFTQGVVWNLNSFDQWGVEYGKQLAKQILDEIDPDTNKRGQHDASTQSLIQKLLKS